MTMTMTMTMMMMMMMMVDFDFDFEQAMNEWAINHHLCWFVETYIYYWVCIISKKITRTRMKGYVFKFDARWGLKKDEPKIIHYLVVV